tara:strand:- start:308 stop:1009 length:702 start_codon:yes stop_codon:yes gene_type:complete
MKNGILFFLILFINSCNERKVDFFPLKEGNIWNYDVEIYPNVEDKVIYKKNNYSLPKTNLKINSEKIKETYPILREDNSIYYYSKNKNGVYREAIQFANQSPLIYEKEKKYVLKYPIKVGEKWSSQSKTFLIIRRYPYFDYRATTDFEIDYEITSVNETVKVPAGKFNKCIKIEGKGNATFIGDREIGLIKIAIKTTEWFAPGVGLVKIIRKEETDSDLFGKSKMVQVLNNFD